MTERVTALTELKGVGHARAQAFFRIGIESAEDLIGYYPRDYEDRREFTPIAQIQRGQSVMIRAQLLNTPAIPSAIATWTPRRMRVRRASP